VHIGEPKTGTTFLQRAMWENRARLARQGVLLPGYKRQDHSRASRDLRDAERPDNDPADSWIGEWDVLVSQALQAPGAAVISDEVLAACTPEQADRAVRSLLSAELHVILAVRDFATLLPAEWQEAVKTRGTESWEEWLRTVIDVESIAADRHLSRFWSFHDTLASLDMWSRHIPPDQVHVITMPRQGANEELWRRFGSVIGVDPGSIELTGLRTNASLGLGETEFLRLLNAELPEDLPYWFYTRYVKHLVAHNVLDARSRRERLVLPPDREAWARQQSETLVAGLRESKFHIVGDLDELLARPAGGSYLSPNDQPAEHILGAAVAVAAALVDQMYRERYPARRQQKEPRGLRQKASELEWTILNGRWTKRVLRSASHIRAVRRLRVAIWHLLMHPARVPGQIQASHANEELVAESD
jgi:hypothetical protein